MTTDMSIWNSDCHPYGSFLKLAFTNHLQDPHLPKQDTRQVKTDAGVAAQIMRLHACLVWVSDRERLPV